MINIRRKNRMHPLPGFTRDPYSGAFVRSAPTGESRLKKQLREMTARLDVLEANMAKLTPKPTKKGVKDNE